MGRIFQPRQRSDGRWDYELSSGEMSHVVGYCAGWHYDDGSPHPDESEAWAKARASAEPFHMKYHSHGHGTEQEARRCFNEFLLDMHLSIEHARTEEPCVLCGVGTVRRVALSNLHVWAVCTKHDARTLARERVMQAQAVRHEIEQGDMPSKVGALAQEENDRPPKKHPPRTKSTAATDRESLPGPLDKAQPRG